LFFALCVKALFKNEGNIVGADLPRSFRPGYSYRSLSTIIVKCRVIVLWER